MTPEVAKYLCIGMMFIAAGIAALKDGMAAAAIAFFAVFAVMIIN